jgi:hypothetical protein
MTGYLALQTQRIRAHSAQTAEPKNEIGVNHADQGVVLDAKGAARLLTFRKRLRDHDAVINQSDPRLGTHSNPLTHDCGECEC